MLENNKCTLCGGAGEYTGGTGKVFDCDDCQGTGKKTVQDRTLKLREEQRIEAAKKREAEAKEKVKEETTRQPAKLTLEAYSKESRDNASYPNRGTPYGLAYAALGLNGEAGEVAEKIKKVLRDGEGVITEETREAIKRELGDSLWYLDAVANECGISLEEVARTNLQKLADRRKRKVISGNGDNR